MHTKVMQHADSFICANAESDLRDIFPSNPGAPRAPWLKKDNSPLPKRKALLVIVSPIWKPRAPTTPSRQLLRWFEDVIQNQGDAIAGSLFAKCVLVCLAQLAFSCYRLPSQSPKCRASSALILSSALHALQSYMERSSPYMSAAYITPQRRRSILSEFRTLLSHSPAMPLQAFRRSSCTP